MAERPADLLPILIEAVQKRDPRWDLVDDHAVGAARDPHILGWAMRAGIEHTHAHVRELAVLLLCLAEKSLAELVPIFSDMVRKDPSEPVRKYAALLLWAHGNDTCRTDLLFAIVEIALEDSDISDSVKKAILGRCPDIHEQLALA